MPLCHIRPRAGVPLWGHWGGMEIISYGVCPQGADLTFDLLVFPVPASKLLALGGGDVGIVGAVNDGGDHVLEKKEERHSGGKEGEGGNIE